MQTVLWILDKAPHSYKPVLKSTGMIFDDFLKAEVPFRPPPAILTLYQRHLFTTKIKDTLIKSLKLIDKHSDLNSIHKASTKM
uniref:Uncharacterized protein n=2 Tax=Loa loa TaxID=7209 RepID=A0A1I7W397_LOALO